MQIDLARVRAAITRMRRSDRAVAVGELVLFVSLFFPWFGLGFFGSASGISAHGWLFLVMLECLGVLGYLAWAAARPSVSLAPAHWQGLIAATGFASFLTLLGVLISPSGSSLMFGAIIALGGAGAALAGAITTRLAMGREPASGDDGERPDLVALGIGLARRWRAFLQASSPPSGAQPPASPQASSVTETAATAERPQARSQPAVAFTTSAAHVPVSQDRPAEAAIPGTGDGPKAPPVGRGAIRVLRWGASLAMLGWAVWLISVWKAAHPPSGSLSCTIGQPAPIPGWGTCTPALQGVLAQFSSAGNQFVASQWLNYHLNVAWTGLALAVASLIVAYLYLETPLLGARSRSASSGGSGSPKAFVSPRKIWLAVILLGVSAALAGTGALIVQTVHQLGSALSAAERACSALGVSCVSVSGYVGLAAGWIAVVGGGLAVLGGLLCAVSLAVRRRRVIPSAGTQAAAS